MAQTNGNSSLIGSVFERKPGPSAPRSLQTSNAKKTGFPSAKHRSQSAFARTRNIEKAGGRERLREPPAVSPFLLKETPMRPPTDDWRHQMETENLRKIQSMSPEELEHERREIFERFGSGISDLLQKARDVRAAREPPSHLGDMPLELQSPQPLNVHVPIPRKAPRKSALVSRPTSPLSANSTRPPSRERHIRFAELTPNDVHVYESAPPSPRRKAIALPAPSDNDGPTVSLGNFADRLKLSTSTTARDAKSEVDVEEGTPEFIRRRFFPSESANDPSLAWITGSTPSSTGPSNPLLRFDLSGTPIPPALVSTLPSHLGLHHHAEGTQAGYTLDDIFLLSRSTVPGQRATMLDILRRIAQRLAGSLKDPSKSIPDFVGQEHDLRKRILAAGIEAMGERGSVGAQAVGAIWMCLVGWDEELIFVEGVELKNTSDDEVISSLPLEFVLAQITSAIAATALPAESLRQLLAIVHRLAQHTNDLAIKIMETPKLVAQIVQTFLLTPIPPQDESDYPEPFAIQVLTTLALASRSNASALAGPADALLRFVVTLPNSSSYPLSLAVGLLTSTLRLYSTLASYGFYAQIATTAYEHFHKVEQYVLSEECRSVQLREAWLNLLESWMVCARDPHRTTPTHEVLWSQVIGWAWHEDILALRHRLTAGNATIWSALWRTGAAWLEGASVNGVKGGEAEKITAIEALREGFGSGVEREVVEASVRELGRLLEEWTITEVKDLPVLQDMAKHADVIAAAIRLWLSCLPSASQAGLESPPFHLPFMAISTLCGILATHSIWSAIVSKETRPFTHLFFRPLSTLLSSYLNLSRVTPGTSDDLWMAQAFTVILRLLPGDDDIAIRIIEDVTVNISQPFMESHGWLVPPLIWEKKAMDPIVPFLTCSLRRKGAVVGPYWKSPKSISAAITQRLPPLPDINPESRKEWPLPISKDWEFAPLNYLLRSGQTDIFKTLPSSWDYSETEIVRATLLLARVQREVLRLHGLYTSWLTREEVVFGCMKVFMLEHEQHQDSASEEVFRDNIVGSFMEDLVAPHTIGLGQSSDAEIPPGPNLEVVAKRFLGEGTPFYQFYTDFVGLYDSISFGHPLFARLLLPPTSMEYPVDYRKYLWLDYSHVIKTIRVPIESVIAKKVEQYLYPVETSAEVISAYLRGLVRSKLEGFVRLVAIHHIASNIWPDMREGPGNDDQSAKLLQAAVAQGDNETVREVVLYRQSPGQAVVMPPVCFEEEGDFKTRRREFLERCESAVKERVESLLLPRII